MMLLNVCKLLGYKLRIRIRIIKHEETLTVRAPVQFQFYLDCATSQQQLPKGA